MKTIYTFVSAILLLFSLDAHADSPIRSGDRIAIVGNTFADQLRIHGYLESLLLQHRNVSIRNLGWGGDMLTARDRPTNFPTETATLTNHKTDVIIACFGMGESFEGEAGIPNFKQDLESFLTSHQGKQYNGKSPVRLVLVSPIAYEDQGRRTPSLEKRNRELESYTKAMSQVASVAKVPFVDLYEPSRYLMSASENAKLTTNGIHLNSFGYWALSYSFSEQLLGKPRAPWRLTIDAKTVESSSRGVEISEVSTKNETIHFVVAEKSLPSLPPPIDTELPPQLSSKRDTLVVTNLKPGNYILSIDNTEVTTASHQDWARGVPVDSSPAHQEAEAFRAAVNDKNQQFIYSWKALNQVHIVGERKTSPSGRALPKEVIEFNQLTNQRDKALRGMIKSKTRQWTLAPSQN